MSALYRQLPSVDRVLADPRVAPLPRAAARWATRGVLDALRAGIADGSVREVPDVVSAVVARTTRLLTTTLRPVINATGVVVHTNLGRAPWAPEAVQAAVAVAGACNLEMVLETGDRGGRLAGVAEKLAFLTGAEASLVVNNCAAAVLLALTALARDREVVASRGELVEIGGSFRVPDVIASGGARLVEVGTTNRTRIGDYAAAVGPDTAVLLAVHPSNFRMVGFTEQVGRGDLVALARAHDLVVVEDLGSGSLDGRFGEPAVRDAVTAGVDVVTFSGDKLLGGPQAGVIVGRRAAVERLRRHPMYRALRVGKVTLASLEATLAVHASGGAVPVQARLAVPLEILDARAAALRAALDASGVPADVRPDTSYTGGGARPGEPLPTRIVTVQPASPDDFAHALRTGDPAVVPRVGDGVVKLDVRTVSDAEVDDLARRVAAVWSERYDTPR